MFICTFKGECSYRISDKVCTYKKSCSSRKKADVVQKCRISNIQLEDVGVNPTIRTKLNLLKECIIEDINRFSSTTDVKSTIREALVKRKCCGLKDKVKTFLNFEEKYFHYLDFRDLPLNKVNFVLKRCKTKDEKELWRYVRVIVSSAPWTGYVGKQLKYLLMDEDEEKVFGIIGLGSDLLNLNPRNVFLGIKNMSIQEKLKRINYLMNMFVCVGVYPFSLFTGGKLLALVSVSNNIIEDYQKVYDSPIYGITTTSLYGKSIQYDRLNDPTTNLANWNYLGLTEGFQSTIHLSSSTRRYIDELFNDLNLSLPHKKITQTFVITHKLGKVSRFLGLTVKDILSPGGNKRGVYFCWLINNNQILKSLENCEPNYIDRSFDDIMDYWKKRWFKRRWKKYHSRSKDLGNYKLEEILNEGK